MVRKILCVGVIFFALHKVSELKQWWDQSTKIENFDQSTVWYHVYGEDPTYRNELRELTID